MKRELRRRSRTPFLSFKDKCLILLLTTIVMMCAIGYLIIFLGGLFVIDKEKLTLDATTSIVAKDNRVIGKIYQEDRVPVQFETIPDEVVEAYVAIEDRRFYEHQGIDYKSMFRAVFRDIVAQSKVEGGSTITQQLAKNLFFENEKSWLRKAKEAMAANYLERHYSKDDILEMYLNTIYFGSGAYGVENASQKFFSKSVTDLTLEEGALLAGLAKAPNGYSPIDHPDKALERRNVVLYTMKEANMLTTSEYQEAKEKPLRLDIQETEEKPWVDSYIDLVMKEAADKYNLSVDDLRRGGYQVVANIDEAAQKAAYERFLEDDYFPGSTSDVEGAFIMKEAKTGEIKAVMGGRDFELGELNRVNVNRQPGSSFKPIAVYGPALMLDDYTPYSLLPDREIDSEVYHIDNADHQYDDIVSLYTALVQSKNTSPTWLLDQISIGYAKDYLEKMGISIADDGLAMALGGLEEGVSPAMMLDAYSAFANHGEIVESATISQIYNRKGELVYQSEPKISKVFSKQVAWEMTEMLSYAVQYGTASAGEYSHALAGKTGTTGHPLVEGENKDAWFVGFTPEMVTALWIGHDVSDKDHYLTGGSAYPTRLTKTILADLDPNTLGENFVQPDDVEGVPNPIQLPVISNLTGEVEIGGKSLFQGKLKWTGSEDKRVRYRIYREKPGIDERIGEVEGETEFVVTGYSLVESNAYYIVPYDPLTKMEGQSSEKIELSFD